MTLRLQREPVSDGTILGALYCDGVWQCWTLEPAAKAIPAGRYRVSLYPSPKHHRLVPLLHDVPGRSMIELHIGNEAHDSDGCILVGQTRAPHFVGYSSPALTALMEKLDTPAPTAISIVVADPW